jgi:hypothetical protein
MDVFVWTKIGVESGEALVVLAWWQARGRKMLGTAFYGNLIRPEVIAKAWTYVGRFIWGFATIEYEVNQRVQDLFDVGPAGAASVFLTYQLDLRKKLDLLDRVLQGRGIDESKTFKRIHAFHDLRNVFAHWPMSEGEDGNGLWCDFIDKEGKLDFAIPSTGEKTRYIKYADLDSYDTEMSVLREKLEEIPVAPISQDDRIAIEEAISSSDNVVRFPTNLREEE